MPTCPLCESTQPLGEACDACGWAFPASEAVAAPIALLPDLETTHHPRPGDDAPSSRLLDLEPTAQLAATGEARPEPLEGFSPTAAEAVGVEVTPLEVERVGDDAVLDSPSQPGPVACRYCRTPAAAGQRLCAACGMQLPLVRSSPTGAGEAAPCSDCGIPMTGTQCPACGARRATLR
jgi:hypothetical protein